MAYENTWALSLRRCFVLPFRRFENSSRDGRVYDPTGHLRQAEQAPPGSEIETEHKPIIAGARDWGRMKELAQGELEQYQRSHPRGL